MNGEAERMIVRGSDAQGTGEVCEMCGSSTEPTWTFCGICGGPLTPATAYDEAAWRSDAQRRDNDLFEFMTANAPVVEVTLDPEPYALTGPVAAGRRRAKATVVISAVLG